MREERITNLAVYQYHWERRAAVELHHFYHTECGARFEHNNELRRSNPNYQAEQEEERRAEVRNRTLFTAALWLPPAEAIQAQCELARAGYGFKITDEDPEGVTAEVWRSAPAGLNEMALWRQLEDIIEPLDGSVSEGGLVEDLVLERQLHPLQ